MHFNFLAGWGILVYLLIGCDSLTLWQETGLRRQIDQSFNLISANWWLFLTSQTLVSLYIMYGYNNISLTLLFWRLNRTNNINYSKHWLNLYTVNKTNILFHSNQRNFCVSKNNSSNNNKKGSKPFSCLCIGIWSQAGMSTIGLNVTENLPHRSQPCKKQWPVNTSTTMWNPCKEVDQTH